MRFRFAMPALAAAATLTGTAFTFTAPAAGSAALNELTYGSTILLQNQYQGDGGYLDTNGLSQQSGAKYDVSTNQTPNSRGPRTSEWKVVSATGKANGHRVISGDVVYLVNQYSTGTYLDTNGRSTRSGAKYDVSTTAHRDRGHGTSKWHIFGKTSSPPTATSAPTTSSACSTTTAPPTAVSSTPTAWPASRVAPSTTCPPATTATAAPAPVPGRSSPPPDPSHGINPPVPRHHAGPAAHG